MLPWLLLLVAMVDVVRSKMSEMMLKSLWPSCYKACARDDGLNSGG